MFDYRKSITRSIERRNALIERRDTLMKPWRNHRAKVKAARAASISKFADDVSSERVGVTAYDLARKRDFCKSAALWSFVLALPPLSVTLIAALDWNGIRYEVADFLPLLILLTVAFSGIAYLEFCKSLFIDDVLCRIKRA